MNAEQVKAKKADAKAVSSKIHEEGAELEQQIREIRENHESIQVELETSEKLEQELTEQIASYQKELDQERERESKQLLESEKVHLAYAAMEQKYQFLLEMSSVFRKRSQNSTWNCLHFVPIKGIHPKRFRKRDPD